MTRYKHLIRSANDAPQIRETALNGYVSGFYRFILTAHGYNLGDQIKLTGYIDTPEVNGIHTVNNVISSAQFTIDVAQTSTPSENGFSQLVDLTTYLETYPLNFTQAKFVYDRIDGQIFYTRKLSGELTFINVPNNSTYDYDYFANIEDTDQCQNIEYLLQQECNGVFLDYFEGKFSVFDGKWNRERCEFRIEPLSITPFDCVLSEIDVNILDTSPTVITRYDAGSNDDRDYENSRLFSDVIEYLVTQTCPEIYGVISDFYQINPENESDINYVTGEFNKYKFMTVAAVKDVKEPIPANLQEELFTTFIEFMHDLNVLHNVFFTIEDNILRIEHQSFFDATFVFDLTQSKYDKFDTGKNIYSYERLPKMEQWTVGRSSYKLNYDSQCSGENINKLSTSFIDTDIIDLRLTVLQDRFKGNEDGVILFATEFVSGSIYHVLGSTNQEMFLLTLIQKFQRHGRAQMDGELTTIGGTVIEDPFLTYTAKKNKLQETISIPLCCDDLFNPEDIMNTTLGEGIVKNASFSTKDNMLKIDIAYGPNSVTDIEPDDISGLALWLKADAGITQSGGFVSQWADQSGNGRHAVQADASKQPFRITSDSDLNGKPSIQFFGVNDGMSTSSFQTFPSKRGSVFIVFKNEQPINLLNDHLVGTRGNGSGVMWDISTIFANEFGGSTLNYKHLYDTTNAEYLSLNTIGEDVVDVAFDYQLSTYGYTNFILCEILRNADSSEQIYINGNLIDLSGPIPNTQPAANPVNIGNSFIAGNSDPLNGRIAEIIIYDSALGDYERQQIENYLFKKYALFQYV